MFIVSFRNFHSRRIPGIPKNRRRKPVPEMESIMAEHHPLASRYPVLSAHCLITVLCVTNVYNNGAGLWGVSWELRTAQAHTHTHVY